MNKIIPIVLSIALSSSLFGQDASKEVDNQEVEFAEQVSAEFSVPAIPALNFISSDPDDISRPSNVKTLAAGLYNGIDEEGKVKQGLALEARIAEFIPINISPEEYRNNAFKYMLYNTQLSVGTVATSGDATSTDLGWGIRITILDYSDPMRNKAYLQEFESLLLELGAPLTPDAERPSDEELAEKLKNAKRPVRDSFAKDNWNASWLTLAYAGGTRLKGSEVTQGKDIGLEVWLSGGLPLNSWGQFSYLLKWSEERYEQSTTKLREFELGTKFLAGTKSYNFFAEASYNPVLNKDKFVDNNAIDTDQSFSWVVGIEFKISSGIWAVTGIGEESERIIGSNGIQVLSGLRFGISDKARLKK